MSLGATCPYNTGSKHTSSGLILQMDLVHFQHGSCQAKAMPLGFQSSVVQQLQTTVQKKEGPQLPDTSCPHSMGQGDLSKDFLLQTDIPVWGD